MKVFSVYDSKAQAYLQPFYAVNAAVALRTFERAVRDETSDFNRYAPDYTLFEIGLWDQDTGELQAHAAKISLGVAVEFLVEREGVNGNA